MMSFRELLILCLGVVLLNGVNWAAAQNLNSIVCDPNDTECRSAIGGFNSNSRSFGRALDEAHRDLGKAIEKSAPDAQNRRSTSPERLAPPRRPSNTAKVLTPAIANDMSATPEASAPTPPQADRTVSLESLEVETAEFVDGEATRIFAGPNEYPPENFGAYAIIAFKSGAGVSEIERYEIICQAFFLAIPESTELTPIERQLVTVWPLSNANAAHQLSTVRDNSERSCEIAARHYGHVTGLRAIRDARKVSTALHESVSANRGPFLFAWNPSNTKGTDDALILRMDLSNVETVIHAKRRFEFWVQEIETQPHLWLDGWQPEPIKSIIATNLDKYGEIILDFFGG